MELLEKLINLDGVSSNEYAVRNFLIKEIKPHIKDVRVDKMGNVIAVKPGKKPAIMLMAHMDEVGMMVSSISKEGKISISPIGGIDPYILLGHKVYLSGKKELAGVITTSEVLDGAEVKKNLIMDDLFVFTGLDKKELAVSGIKIGTYVTFGESSRYCVLSKAGEKEIIAGKALDDRIGCYLLLELIKNLKTENEVIFVFTVQEEVGLYGAKASVFNIEPDYAIAIDVTPHNNFDESIMLGNGPVLTVKDAEMISHKCLVDGIEKSAEKAKVNIQLEVSEAGTTDATSVFAAKGGIPSTVFGVAVGNLHTSLGVASKKDIISAVKVLKEFLRNPPKECWV